MNRSFAIALLCTIFGFHCFVNGELVPRRFVGGPGPDIPLDTEGVSEAHKLAVSTTTKQNGLCEAAMILKSVKRQLVSGYNYHLTYELNQRSCSGENGNGEAHNPITCKIIVYVQAWTNTIKVTKNECIGTTIPDKV